MPQFAVDINWPASGDVQRYAARVEAHMARPEFIYEYESNESDVSIDNLAMSYLLIEIDRLNNVLKSSVHKPAARRSVVEDYFNGHVDLLNGYSFTDTEINSDKWAPKLAFGRIEDEEEMHLNPVYVQGPLCPLEEYLGGLISQYFDEWGESLPSTLELET